jgi:hypothetical protein
MLDRFRTLCVGLSCWGLVACSTLTLRADDPAEAEQITPEALQFFETRIRPVLVENCYRCHSASEQGTRGGLAIDSREGLLAGGESGPAIVPGSLSESLLWNAINHRDFEMPPKRRLPAAVIADFKQWIEMGAPDPRRLEAQLVRSRVTAEDIAEGRKFWSFQPPRRTAPDASSSYSWARSELDRFVEARWLEHDLQPVEDAGPRTLVKRLYFDLIGLPPTPDELSDFLTAWQADADAALASTVDNLLERPQFGERWGRYWLDVARYAESSGKEIDQSFPHAWRYRNYVIDAFNTDKPYDQFVREQIAGDLLPTDSDAKWTENLIATGFLAIGPKALAEQNPRQFQADLIDEQIDSTTRVFLGISVACARCHDHKFDPIPQTDYYALAGIFQSTQTLYGGVRSQRNRQPSQLIILPIDDPNPGVQPISREELAQLKELRDQRSQEYREARIAMRNPQPSPAMAGRNADAGTTPEASAPESMAAMQRRLFNAGLLDQVVAQLTERINSVDSDGQPLTFCMGVQEANQMREARVLVRGEIDQPAQSVPRGLVQVLCAEPVVIPRRSSGRLELAEWLASRDNPLTARVMVNRVWQHLIGQAIVREQDNFGVSGPAPTHPELLDWLACEFMEHNWSVKHLIRQIARSRVYRLSSRHDPVLFEADPDNRLIARANVRRLDAEALRDAMLAVSGQLDLNRPRASVVASYGAAVIGPNGPQIPPAMLLNMTGGMNTGPGTTGANMAGALGGLRQRSPGGPGSGFNESVNKQRSVYLPVVRNALPRMLSVFDFAEPSLVVGQREVSHTAEQALFMLNNPFVIDQSEAMARRITAAASSQEEQIGLAFRLAYGRDAEPAELQASQAFFASYASAAGRGSSSDPRSTGAGGRGQNRQRGSMGPGGGSGAAGGNGGGFGFFGQATPRNITAFGAFCQALLSSAEFRFVN